MRKRKILVADDDPITLSTIRQGLHAAGYRVYTATDGAEAVRIGRQQRPDLAVLDIRMPAVFGIEAARRLRHQAAVPSIFLTAYGDKELVDLATKEGALGYLLKPVQAAQLVPMIAAALERSAELKRLQQSELTLTGAIKSNRTISLAIGIYMEHFKLDERQAAEEIRTFARSKRSKLVDIALKLTSPRTSRYPLIQRVRDYNQRTGRYAAGEPKSCSDHG
ncbi:MAG: response regulator [Gammaproteobacteria bacterium]|nr:response regulator [Gammaproteobacteria bacterium]